MTFEKDYESLILFAKKIIYSKKLFLSEIDIVNDVYLDFTNENKHYNIDNIKKKISVKIINESRDKSTFGITDTNLSYKSIDLREGKYCKSCNEYMPSAAFHYLYNSRTKTKDLSTYCKVCHRKKEKEYRIKKGKFKGTNDMSGTCKKEKNRVRVANYVKKNKDKWNAYLRERYMQKKLLANNAKTLKATTITNR